MARFQTAEKWIQTSLVCVLVGGLVGLSQACHPTSKELHICLNIYLERDFITIETILKGQQTMDRFGRGRVLLEGPDLQNICRDIWRLRKCLADTLGECDTYWQLERFSRMMHVLAETHTYLCGNSTDNVRDLLLRSSCLMRSKDHIAHCSGLGFSWMMTWREVLRLEVDPGDRCPSLNAYRDCLMSSLKGVLCGTDAIHVYGGLLDVWLRNWCNKNSSPEQDLAYIYLQALKYVYPPHSMNE